MNKDRTILELLDLMLANQHLFERGLCLWANRLTCEQMTTISESRTLWQYIHNNKPEKFENMPKWKHWWCIGEIKPRLIWISEQITKLKNNEQ